MADIVTVNLGDAQVTLIQDGAINLPADEMLPGFVPADWAGLLPEPRPGQLVRVDGEVILIDSGLGLATEEDGQGGALLPALAELGVAPGAVTRVIITHTHGDHLGGLLDRSGATPRPVFPRARHHLPRADWAWVEGFPAETRDAYLDPLRVLPELTLDDADARLTPSVRSVGAAGHTPGHRCIVVASGGRSFAFLGDLVHSPTLHFATPERATTWDAQPDLPPPSRRRIAAAAVAGGGVPGWTWRPSGR